MDALLAAGASSSLSPKTSHHTPGSLSIEDRRLSVAGLLSSQPARDQRDETTIEDVELSNSFQLHSTFVKRGSHGNDETDGRGSNYETEDSMAPSTPAPPTFVVPASPHVSLGPGPLHLAAK